MRRLVPVFRSQIAGVSGPRRTRSRATGNGMASHKPDFGRITARRSWAPTITGAFDLAVQNLTSTGAVTVNGAITVDSLTTFGAGYALSLLEGGTITQDVNFLNTGALTLGDAAGDTRKTTSPHRRTRAAIPGGSAPCARALRKETESMQFPDLG